MAINITGKFAPSGGAGTFMLYNLADLDTETPAAVTLADDKLAITAGSAVIKVAAQAGAADDIDGISGFNEGQFIILRADTGDTITLKDENAGAAAATDRIRTLGGVDMPFTEDEAVLLYHDVTLGRWIVVAGPEPATAHAHDVYALLAGRSGGQTLIGGIAANEDLLLQATSHATRATSQVQLFVDTNATMTLNATAQIFGSAINEVQFLNVTAVDFTNAAGFEIVRFSDASAAGGPAVTFATGELQVNEDIDISGHIAIGAAASVDSTAGAVLVLAETATATGAVEVNQMDIAHTYTPGAISSARFRGLRMDVTAGGDEDIDGAFLAGAYALQFVMQHDSEGDINQMFGATGQCIMGNNPLDAASTNTPQFGNFFAQGVGLQGLFIYSANDGYAGGNFQVFPDAAPLGVKAIDAQLQLRSFHDFGRIVTLNGETSGIAVTMDTNNQGVGPKTNRITITDLAGIRISHNDTTSVAAITNGFMLKIGAWSAVPAMGNQYGISQDGTLDSNWLAGFTQIGGAGRPSSGDIAAAALTVDQDNVSGAIPALKLDQADVSEEMIEFISTIGVGNAIEAKGGKSLTETHFIKVTLPGPLTRYIEVGTIA